MHIDAHRVLHGWKAVLHWSSRAPLHYLAYTADVHQFAGVIITVGIVLATLSAPRRPPTKSAKSLTATTSQSEYLSEKQQYIAGIGLLSLALFLSAWLGIWQERTYRQYGKQWREGLFYSVGIASSIEL